MLTQRAKRALLGLKAALRAEKQNAQQKERLRITLPNRATPAAQSGIAIVAIFLNEADYLEEWIEFHRVVGVDHFFLYDNGSTDASSRLLANYVQNEIVTVIPWRNFAKDIHMQWLAYAHAISNFGQSFQWFAMIDIDEFLFSECHDTLKEAFEHYADFSAIRIPRFEYGPSGHKTRPAGLVIDNYIYCSNSSDPAYAVIKSAVRPARVTVAHTHRCEVDGSEIAIERRPQTSDCYMLRINHYLTKSEEEFSAKMQRGWILGVSQNQRQRANDLLANILNNSKLDDSIRKFSSILNSRLKLNR